METCVQCAEIREKLELVVGKKLTQRLIGKILGDIPIESKLEIKSCSICGKGNYAKGLCLSHYMAARRKVSSQFVCANCHKAIVNGAKGQDEQWYCNVCLGKGHNDET